MLGGHLDFLGAVETARLDFESARFILEASEEPAAFDLAANLTLESALTVGKRVNDLVIGVEAVI